MTINPLVAGRVDQGEGAWAGVWIAEDIELIAQGVRGGNWIDGTLGAVGAGLDGLALVSDPVGALLQYGISWLIEHVRPLSEALDWLAGDPAQIAAHAQTWRNAASELRTESDEFARAVRHDITEWQGTAATAYRAWAAQRDGSLDALARACDTMGAITEGAGILVGTVRIMVRDAIATVVSRLIVYAGELVASAGLATPLVVEQVTTLVASWAAKITHWLKSLISSLRRLMSEGGRLADLIEALKRLLRGHSSGNPGRPPGRGSSEPPRPGDADFDPGMHHGPLGRDFSPGVHDPRGLFQAKERAVADRLADEHEMVHPRERIDNVQNLKNPDAMVRTSPSDLGTVTEFKTIESGSSGAVRTNILAAGRQTESTGGGNVVIDGREVGLLEAEARRGYARALGQARAHSMSFPGKVRFILGDGTMMELP
ncbi:WXG100-like domain-containing protein [Mangrovihabitans endophyticus]|uniref:Outer membrane channel protein CpnT-like N-terminal domain-containing protein n=1 Tax=Mangrovihabitans endophyticus TaxID=1751298 RepID=A0A8J3FMX2_9ACTN|nr:WXG100 family type VII secretion target [Mangrovihabitans endophyticus]GGK86992.1 hypothetical protein GCM10012284_21390 [Mangrovihabitans endophyticus]